MDGGGFFHSRQVVGDLALGKPAVRRLSITATVAEALKLFDKTNEPHLGLWVQQVQQQESPFVVTPVVTTLKKQQQQHHQHHGSCSISPPAAVAINHNYNNNNPEEGGGGGGDGGTSSSKWQCVGRVSMIEILCFLARDESLLDLAGALKTPLSVFISPVSSAAVHHVDSRTKLFEALECFLDGVQHLVVPIDCSSISSSRISRCNSSPIPNTKLSGAATAAPRNINMHNWPQSTTTTSTTKLRHFCISVSQNNIVVKPECETIQEYCWLTPEDVVRFLLSCIGLFSPIPMMSIQQLGLINTEVLVTHTTANAVSAVPLIQRAAREMTAVAVVEEDEDDSEDLKLVGDISAFTMKGCNETAALALATLSVQDFLSYAQDCGGPPNSLVELVQSRVREKLMGHGSTTTTAINPISGRQQLTTPPNSGTGSSILDHHHHQHQHHRFSAVSKGLAPFLLAGCHHGSDTTGSEESSDDDQPTQSPDGPLALSFNSVAARQQPPFSRGRTAPNMCRPWSSLVAVMVQALTHRVGYIWVTDDMSCLLGIVTYLDMINSLLSKLYESSSPQSQ